LTRSISGKLSKDNWKQVRIPLTTGSTFSTYDEGGMALDPDFFTISNLKQRTKTVILLRSH
jgi:hypothetical protein